MKIVLEQADILGSRMLQDQVYPVKVKAAN